MHSISPSILPAISSEGDESVDVAGRADDQQVEESGLPDKGAEDQVEDEGNANADQPADRHQNPA